MTSMGRNWRKGTGAQHTFVFGVEGKECSRCKEWRPLTLFHRFSSKWDGLTAQCKKCKWAYQEVHKEEKERKRLEMFVEDPEYFRALWRQNKKNQYERDPEKFCQIMKNNRKENDSYINYLREYRLRIDRRIHSNISRAMRDAMKKDKEGRCWESLVGYTVKDLMRHLEVLFEDGMSWKNYGEWEIDHKRPLSSFKVSSYEDESFKECWALDNLQPLWMTDNRRKWAHIS